MAGYNQQAFHHLQLFTMLSYISVSRWLLLEHNDLLYILFQDSSQSSSVPNSYQEMKLHPPSERENMKCVLHCCHSLFSLTFKRKLALDC